MHTSRVSMTLTAILALGACNGNSTAPGDALSDQQMSTDIAASSAPAVATGAAFFAQAEAAGSTLASVVPSTTPCTMHSNSGAITFSQSESHPDTVAYAATWEYFAGGVCQNMFVVASTDSIAFTASLVEADNDPRFVAHATRNWGLDVTGSPTLASATSHVWNATGLDADTATHQTPGLDRTYSGVAYDTASDVTFPNPRNGVTAPTFRDARAMGHADGHAHDAWRSQGRDRLAAHCRDVQRANADPARRLRRHAGDAAPRVHARPHRPSDCHEQLSLRYAAPYGRSRVEIRGAFVRCDGRSRGRSPTRRPRRCSGSCGPWSKATTLRCVSSAMSSARTTLARWVP